MDGSVQQFRVGDLVVDLREHSPRVGTVTRAIDEREWMSISYSEDKRFGLGMASSDYVPFRVCRPVAGAAAGQRIDRRTVVSAGDDAAPRLPDGLAFYEIVFFAARALKDYNNVGLYVDESFSVGEAEDFLEKRGMLDEEQEWEIRSFCKKGGGELPYRLFPDWSQKQLKALAAENERRKRLAAEWAKRRSELVERLRPIGGAVLQATYGGYVCNESHYGIHPVVWYVALPERSEGDLIAFLDGLRVADVSFEIRRTVDPSDTDFVSMEVLADDKDPFEAHDGMAPRDDETAAEYARRVAIGEAILRAVPDTRRRAGGNAALFAALMRSHSGRGETVEFVIDGLLPREAVALMIGPPKIGKSTLALQAAVDVANGAPFLGLSTRAGTGDDFVVYLSGEDPQSVIQTRARSLSPNGQFDRLLLLDDFSSMPKALGMLDHASVDLLVVDTAAAFVGASVNDAGPAREFMDALRDFAKRKKCAVLVIHHTNKGVTPRSSKATAEGMKGSSEFTSAARVTLTMHEQGERRVLAVYRHNMPASVPMLREALRLTYDPATERHERDDGDESPAGGERQHKADTAVGQQEAAGQRDAEIVATVIRRALAEGRPVALSGKNEPYNLRAPELAGWTRAQVRAAHRRALAAGLIENAAAARAAE